MALTITLETSVVSSIVHAVPLRSAPPAPAPVAVADAISPFLFDGEALTALLNELCAEGSLSREQLRTMVQAAERQPTTAPRRTA